jgi:RimJ/RimL family protein N-acetyltransferase
MEMPRLIDTPRLHLRDMRHADAADVFAAYGADPAVLRYLGWDLHESIADSRRLVGYNIHRRMEGSAWIWGMCTRAPHPRANRVFGQIELIPMSQPADAAHHLRLGYLMAASHWGQGLMSEAVGAVLEQAFDEPCVWRIDALCDLDNHASASLLERIGMRREGCMRRAVLHPNVSSAPRDAWVYAMARDDWEARVRGLAVGTRVSANAGPEAVTRAGAATA